MSVVSKTALTTQINTDLASASNITAAEHRGVAKNIVDSYEDFIGSYTTAEIVALTGMTLRQIVFNEDDNDYEFYDGTQWVKMAHPKYKVYTALLTQTSTNAPVATVLENTLGGTVVWTYDSAGQYTATLNAAFPQAKTIIIIPPVHNQDLAAFFEVKWVSANAIQVYTSTFSGSPLVLVPTDEELLNTPIQILVYY